MRKPAVPLPSAFRRKKGIVSCALLVWAIAAILAVVLSAPPSWAQDAECEFLVMMPKPNDPIDFAGPAGGNDFALSDTSRNPAKIVLTNIYGSGNCGWTLSPSQD